MVDSSSSTFSSSSLGAAAMGGSQMSWLLACLLPMFGGVGDRHNGDSDHHKLLFPDVGTHLLFAMILHILPCHVRDDLAHFAMSCF